MQPGSSPAGPPPAVDDNMTMSIVAIFLFWPLAIPAIINASRVRPLLARGDLAGARQAAAESRRWSRLALIIGIILYVIGLVCCVAGIVGGVTMGGRTSY